MEDGTNKVKITLQDLKREQRHAFPEVVAALNCGVRAVGRGLAGAERAGAPELRDGPYLLPSTFAKESNGAACEGRFSRFGDWIWGRVGVLCSLVLII